jgi:hypothetical protein
MPAAGLRFKSLLIWASRVVTILYYTDGENKKSAINVLPSHADE